MSKYTNQAKVASFLQRALTANEIAIFDMVNQNISNLINLTLNRKYNDLKELVPPATADSFDVPVSSVRYFDGNHRHALDIDDFISVSKIELLDSQGEVSLEITSVSDYIKYPLNASVYETIHLRNYRFPNTGAANVRITAVFSSGNVHSAVMSVVTALVAKFLQEVPLMSTGYTQESIEGYSYRLKSAGKSETEQAALLNSLGNLKKYTW
jgi:hypothetical protein